VLRALGPCVTDGGLVNVLYLAGIADNAALYGFMDPPSSLAGARVWFMSANNDTVVARSVVQANVALTSMYLSNPGQQVQTVYNVPGEHAQLTDSYGSACTYLGSPYINHCGYAAAQSALAWLYPATISPPGPAPADDDPAPAPAAGAGVLTCRYGTPAALAATARDTRAAALPTCTAPPPSPDGVPVLRTAAGTVYNFNQGLFVDGGGWSSAVGLAQTAFIYIPDVCLRNGSSPTTVCTLHTAFHGCLQTIDDIGTQYVTDGGYLPLADANNLVVLFPQAISNLLNPKGCFDWWGYAGPQYASNIGTQTLAVKRVMDVVMGQPITPNRSLTHAEDLAAFTASTVPLPRKSLRHAAA